MAVTFCGCCNSIIHKYPCECQNIVWYYQEAEYREDRSPVFPEKDKWLFAGFRGVSPFMIAEKTWLHMHLLDPTKRIGTLLISKDKGETHEAFSMKILDRPRACAKYYYEKTQETRS